MCSTCVIFGKTVYAVYNHIYKQTGYLIQHTGLLSERYMHCQWIPKPQSCKTVVRYPEALVGIEVSKCCLSDYNQCLEASYHFKLK